jgi:hypothetical protein
VFPFPDSNEKEQHLFAIVFKLVLFSPGRIKKTRTRDIEREGEIRVKERVREVKGAQSKPNPSPNDFPKLWEARV